MYTKFNTAPILLTLAEGFLRVVAATSRWHSGRRPLINKRYGGDAGKPASQYDPGLCNCVRWGFYLVIRNSILGTINSFTARHDAGYYLAINNKHRRAIMETLTYSSNRDSPLNKARLQLWCAKEVLAEANRKNDNEMRGRAMGYINKDRTALRELVQKLRAKLPARKVYRIHMRGEASDFGFWERAHTRGQAMYQAANRYPDFDLVQVDELE